MVKTNKQKFNKKYKQPLNKSNSLDEISNLTGFKKSGLKNIKTSQKAGKALVPGWIVNDWVNTYKMEI